MKAFVAGVLLALPAVAFAGTHCASIEDPDQRAYCRAIQTNSAGQCTFISDYSLRQTCRARLGGGTSACNTVQSQWEREKCKREAERR